MLIGYVTEEEILDINNPFDTLISGLVWLVRDGRNYVSKSMYDDGEDMTSQNTGISFATVLSARTALGFDKNGRLLILQIEGSTWKRGMNLYEFADFAVELGFLAAINLDGGGSATMTQNDVLISEPSWKCLFNSSDVDDTILGTSNSPMDEETEAKYYFCEKEVSTITCIHSIAPPQDVNSIPDFTFQSILRDFQRTDNLIEIILAILLCCSWMFFILIYFISKRTSFPESTRTYKEYGGDIEAKTRPRTIRGGNPNIFIIEEENNGNSGSEGVDGAFVDMKNTARKSVSNSKGRNDSISYSVIDNFLSDAAAANDDDDDDDGDDDDDDDDDDDNDDDECKLNPFTRL